MKIGIIGAGHIGSALATNLVQLGHEVAIANSRGPETLAEVVLATGATAVHAEDAPLDAELVIVTIPLKAVPDLPAGILDTAAPGAPVIDTCNYYPQRDGKLDAIESGTTESRWVADQLGCPVIKAFNNIHAKHLLERGLPAGSDGRIALPIAGDSSDDKAAVMALVDALGFDPVDAGTIDESWRQQPDTPCYGTDLPAAELRKALEAASPERPAGFRA